MYCNGPVKSISIVDDFKSSNVSAVPPAAMSVIFLLSFLSISERKSSKDFLSTCDCLVMMS